MPRYKKIGRVNFARQGDNNWGVYIGYAPDFRNPVEAQVKHGHRIRHRIGAYDAIRNFRRAKAIAQVAMGVPPVEAFGTAGEIADAILNVVQDGSMQKPRDIQIRPRQRY